MKIVLTYMKLKVTLEAEGLDAGVDAILVASAVLTETGKLNYGSPTIDMNTEDVKIVPRPRS